MISREQMKQSPPHIFITNYAMLEYLMLRPADSIFFSKEYSNLWKYIILDEAHVYNGSTGIEVSMLLRRLKATISNNNIRYILTSATLGDKDSNKEVSIFAEKLCNSEFSEKNVIRAYRENTLTFKYSNNLKINFYNKVAEMIDKDYEYNEIINKIKEIRNYNNNSDNLPELLFDELSKDELYINIRKELIKPVKVKSIEKKFNITSNELSNFVKVASIAEKNNIKLFDARYHMFVKATESIFITLNPSSKLFLKRKKYHFEKDGEAYKVFEIGTCQFCNDIYIIGKIEHNKLIQTSTIGPDDNKSIFLLGDKVSDTDSDHTLEDEKIDTQEYEVCAKCGYILKSDLVNKEYCEHGKQYYTRIIKVKINNESGRLTKCLSCENTSNFGIIRMFFSGQEAVTSVIGTALYEELPSYNVTSDIKIEEDDYGFGVGETVIRGNKEKKAKQFLSFSDNRQAAAFYATYLEQTYTNILYKRLIVETLKDQQDNEGKNVYQFVDNLTNKFEKYNVATYDSDTVKKEAWKAILHEIVDNNGSSSLYKMGMLRISILDDIINGNTKFNLTKNEVSDMCSVLAMGIMTDAALTYNANINKSDKAFFTHGVECKYTLSDSNNKEYTRSFIPSKEKMKNKRIDYLEKILKKKGFNLSLEETSDILKSIWNGLFVGNQFEIMKNINGYYKLDVGKIKISKSDRWYICPKCKKVTAHNVENVCPTYKCNGELKPIEINEEFKENHYYNLYNNMDIRELKIAEHTAQLNKETAYDYQKKFKKKQIDIISCSTTFEMGVDVGSLETVFMRNVPPSPANYAQRAGRAGRSTDSAAFALTFCNKSNHDFAYFNKPEKMIRGKISPPIFNEANNKIAIRHLYASSLSIFWKSHEEYFSNTEKMLEDNENNINGIKLFEKFLKSKPEKLKVFANNFLPSELIDEFRINSFGWINRLIGEKDEIGVLKKAENSYNYEITKITEEIDRAFVNQDSNISRLISRRKVYKNENIISFLSRKNVLPKYGFPVDTVSMSIYDNKYNKNLGIELQRDLSMAIGEYAPGSEIIANGQLITSRYIKKLPNMSWKMYDYVICDECRTLNIETHVEDDEIRELNSCKLCKKSFNNKKVDTFLIPEFGFEADGDNIKKPGLIKPEKTYRSEISYVGYRDDIKPKEFKIGKGLVELILSQGDEMAVLNTSKFFVCESCGYSVLDDKLYSYTKQKTHKNSSGYKCSNKYLKRYSLGYRFETDVIQLRFIQPDIDNWENGLSILNGILRGICSSLNIEDSDIAGTLRYFSNKFTNRANYSIILYDRTPGGSGHVRRLNNEEALEKVIKETYKIVSNCSCGGETGDSACYSCLKNYYNQKYHDILQRKNVIDFINKLYE